MEAHIHSQTCTSSPPPHTAASNASSSDSSSTATASSQPRLTVPDTETTTAQSTPSEDAIEAAIRAAITSSTASSSPRSTSSVASMGKTSGTSDGRTVPPRDTRTQLYVGNLPYRVRWQDLKDLFRRAGTVLRADVSLGPDNRSRGFGTVLLATAEDAGRAIDHFNGFEWQSRILEVRVDRIGGPMPLPGESGMPSQASLMPGVSMMNSNVYMNQPPQASRGILSPAPPFGPSTYSIQNQQMTGQSRQIFSPQPQTLSLSHLHAQLHAPPHGQSQFEQLQQQYQSQQQQQQQPPSIPGRTLFVGNLPYHVQWQDLKDLFRRTPGGVTVLRADVALGPDGRSKGFGTVTLRTEEETERAKRWFSGYEFNGRQLKVHHDRVPISTSASLAASPLIPSHLPSSSPLTQSMAMLNFGDPLTSQRPTSPSPTNSSSSSRTSQAMRLRSETSSLQPPSMNSRSASSPLMRQLQAHQQSQAVHQPSPLYSAVSVELAPSGVSLGDPGQGGDDPTISRHRASSTASIPSPTSTSPSKSRANRPTHISLPPPSFNCDFDPSLDDLDNANAYVERNDNQNRHEPGPPEHQQLQPQTTPLPIHFRQYFQREQRGSRHHQSERDREASRDYPATEVRQQQQLYQLLHGSRQLATSGSNSPKPQLPKLSTTSSATTSSAASAASSTASLFETPERIHQSGHYGPTSLRESHSSGASSAAASTKSLPLGLGGGGGGGGALGPAGASSSKAAFSRDTSPGKSGTRRPLSTVSTTGSATSASDNNSSSTSFSGTSRTGSGKGDVSSVDASEGWLNTDYSEKEGQERSPHPHHPGSIALPPPFSSSGAVGPHDVSESGMGKGLFQQYYPFAKAGSDQEGGGSGGGFVEFSHSGEPTVQARQVRVEEKSDGQAHSLRKDSLSAIQSEMPHQLSSKKDVTGYFQPPAPPPPHGYPPMHPMTQLTPHGLPPMTPSMPPFTFVGSQQAPFLSPGMYPTSPIGPGGTLSLPPQQFVFVPHQQSPIISPASTIGPGTAAPAQMPSGAVVPAASWVARVAHSYHQAANPYGHPPPHPLSNSFGGSAGHGVPAMSPGAVGLAAMSPGAPWGKPGQMMKPYVNAAVGGPVRRNNNNGNRERGSSRSRSRSKDPGREREMLEDASGAEMHQQQQQQYYAHPAGGGGYWGYAHHYHMSGVEPKGYFDQLYMGPGGSREGGEESGGGGGDTSEGGDRSVVEREILKDRLGEGERQNSDSTKSSTDDWASSCQSTSPGSPDTAATTEPEDESHGDRPGAVGGFVPPPLQHAKTDPADVEGPARTRISRSLTGGDEL
ncbi:hypothetical protein H1R20_g474, partial [Candolleomyces eurysporus]